MTLVEFIINECDEDTDYLRYIIRALKEELEWLEWAEQH